MVEFYEIRLPLPTSVNAAHSLTEGRRNYKTKKFERSKVRSADYNDWVVRANSDFNFQFPEAFSLPKLQGRLRLEAIFIWNENDSGHHCSDVDNRLKVLADFLQGKFFENDKQIDLLVAHRRVSPTIKTSAWVRVYAVHDRRYDDPNLIFNPKPQGA